MFSELTKLSYANAKMAFQNLISSMASYGLLDQMVSVRTNNESDRIASIMPLKPLQLILEP